MANDVLTLGDHTVTQTIPFQVRKVQYLDKDSKATQPLPHFAQNKDTLLTLYELMVLTRALDAKAVNLQRIGKMGTYASSLGQEALMVGVGHALQPKDLYATCYRDQGALIQRGVKMSEVLAYWGGDERGNAFQHNKRDFPTVIPIGSHLPHAAGAAFAIKHRKESQAVLTMIGDGGTSQGDFYESINIAGVWKLPLVFVINNNQWAISLHRSQQSGTQTLAQKAIAGGFEGIQIDGNDVIAVREVVDRALTKARDGGGPTLIEAVTYRLCDHTTADDAARYTPPGMKEQAEKEEPIARLRNFLHAENHWDKEKEFELQKRCRAQVEEAVEEYLNMPPQPLEAIFDYLYAELPEALQIQKEILLQSAQEGTSSHE